MMVWIADSFAMIFEGLAATLSGVARIGLILVGIIILYQFLRALRKEPIKYIRGTIGLLLAVIIGFGSPMFLSLAIENPPSWAMLICWPLGWVVAYKIGKHVAGLSDEVGSTPQAGVK